MIVVLIHITFSYHFQYFEFIFSLIIRLLNMSPIKITSAYSFLLCDITSTFIQYQTSTWYQMYTSLTRFNLISHYTSLTRFNDITSILHWRSQFNMISHPQFIDTHDSTWYHNHTSPTQFNVISHQHFTDTIQRDITSTLHWHYRLMWYLIHTLLTLMIERDTTFTDTQFNVLSHLNFIDTRDSTW